MGKQTKTIHLNFARYGLSFGLMLFFLLALIALSVVLIIRYAPASAQMQAIFIAIALPILGLIGVSLFFWQNIEKILRDRNEALGELMLPEEQRQKLNASVRELASILGMQGEEELSNLRAAYVLAEDLALRQIEQEKQVPLKRHVRIGDAQFDALFFDKNYSTLVEVTFVITSSISQEKINKILDKVEKARRKFQQIKSGRKLKLLFVIVTQISQEAERKLKQSLVEKFSATTVDTDIRFFDFEALQRIYTEE